MARAGNAALRREMRERDNHAPEIESLADEALRAVGHTGAGPIAPHVLSALARHLGFRVHPVGDLPTSVRSIADLEHARIYVPRRDELGAQDARSVVLQTLGHFVLGHTDPADFAECLRQRVEANYFAGAVLVPERAAAPLLSEAKAARDLCVEDLEERFDVSYEMAAHRFTNLATRHLGIRVHFVRSDGDGDLEGLRERRRAVPSGRGRRDRGAAAVPRVGDEAGLLRRPAVPAPPPVHRCPRRHVLARAIWRRDGSSATR